MRLLVSTFSLNMKVVRLTLHLEKKCNGYCLLLFVFIASKHVPTEGSSGKINLWSLTRCIIYDMLLLILLLLHVMLLSVCN